MNKGLYSKLYKTAPLVKCGNLEKDGKVTKVQFEKLYRDLHDRLEQNELRRKYGTEKTLTYRLK